MVLRTIPIDIVSSLDKLVILRRYLGHVDCLEFFSSGTLGVVILQFHCYVDMHVLFWPNNLSNRKDEKSVWAGIRTLERYLPDVRRVGALVYDQLLP